MQQTENYENTGEQPLIAGFEIEITWKIIDET